MAVSLATFINPDFSYAAKVSSKIAKLIAKHGLPKGTFLNINVPNKKKSQIRGIKVTRQGLVPIHGTFSKRKDPNLREYHWMTGKIPSRSKSNKTDTSALNNNFVTVTPIQSDQTDYSMLPKLSDWRF